MGYKRRIGLAPILIAFPFYPDKTFGVLPYWRDPRLLAAKCDARKSRVEFGI